MSWRVARVVALGAALGAALHATACAGARTIDPLAPARDHRIGRAVLSLAWTAPIHARGSHTAQEFAAPAIAREGRVELVVVGSQGGTLRALRERDGRVAWRRSIGSTSAQALIHRARVYLGTDDGALVALDAWNGTELWRHATSGAILHAPVLSGSLLHVATDADQVITVELGSGKRLWQHGRETPDEFSLRGHAGITTDGERVFCGFSDGQLVALSAQTGAVLWERSLAGTERRFVDVDATPLLAHGALYAASATGGLYALDPADGTIRWQTAISGVTGLAADADALYVAAAETGLHAIATDGQVLWRQGLSGAGDPSPPVVHGDLLFVTTAARGLFVVARKSGELFDAFDPGTGISASPVLVGDRLYLHSNGGQLYAMSIAAP